MAFTIKVTAVVAVSITALACLAVTEAQAIQLVVNGNSYDVTTFTGSYNSNTSKFNCTDMPWSTGTLAAAFATTLGASFGTPNDGFGPYFAYAIVGGDSVNKAVDLGGSLSDIGTPGAASKVYAILNSSQPSSSSSVPGPLPLFGDGRDSGLN